MTTTARNPFTPTFGIVPLYMAGRDQLISLMHQAFENGIGDPNLSTILIGARGNGKTALLSCISQEATQSGWIAVDVVAADGMLEDIVQQTLEAASHLIDHKTKKHITGLDLGQLIGIQWEEEKPITANWRTRMNAILDQLASMDIGLLITVDEVKASYPEMVQLASTYQLFVREGRKVALVMAGLPKHVSQLISNDDVSFLRRSRQHYLGKIKDGDVEIAFEKTVTSSGKAIEPAALKQAVEAIHGFPYMMQLVGYYSWSVSNGSETLTEAHVERGIALAADDFKNGVLGTTYRELSPGDRRFLNALIACGQECTLASVAKQMGKTTSYASTYRARLAGQGVIEELPGGSLVISPPFFREYLEEASAL